MGFPFCWICTHSSLVGWMIYLCISEFTWTILLNIIGEHGCCSAAKQTNWCNKSHCPFHLNMKQQKKNSTGWCQQRMRASRKMTAYLGNNVPLSNKEEMKVTNYKKTELWPRVNKLFGRFTLKDISFMNFDVPITTFAISVVCLGPPEMTEIKKTVIPLQPQQWRRHVSITSVARTFTVDQ